MGGLGPGIGGFEILVIGLVALLVVGPKDLPVLMKRVGQFMAKMRGMAGEFRASFDEMARQSELDDLRKEVEALRTGQGMHALGPDAEAAFRDIRSDLNQPLPLDEAAPALGRSEWPDAEPVMTPLPTPAVDAPIEPVAAPPKAAARTPRKAAAKPKAAATKSAAPKPKPAAKPRVRRKKAVDL